MVYNDVRPRDSGQFRNRVRVSARYRPTPVSALPQGRPGNRLLPRNRRQLLSALLHLGTMDEPSTTDTHFVDTLLAQRGQPRDLLQILWRVQHRNGCVPANTIDRIATALNLPHAAIYAVIEFYSFLHTTPRGRFDILFSDNITDRMLGGVTLTDDLCTRLGVTPGTPRADGRVTVGTTSCTGMCDQGPAALVNGHALTRLDPARIATIADLVEGGISPDRWPREFFEVHDNIRRPDSLLAPLEDGAGLRAQVDTAPSRLIEIIEESGLRGRGGAGFPTGSKWAYCRNAPADTRHVVCNADEGEPGTFKDRVLLQSYADRVFEGMTLCAHAIGAPHGYLYLRGEYLYMLDDLEAVLQRRRESGLLGRNIADRAGFDFDIEIHLGAGAYICGEESALIESLEGKRGVPRIRPPFPVTHGYLGEPTVVDNVETFVAVTWIAIHGANAFRAQGTPGSAGTKLLSVSGDCALPGIYEFPWGVTIAEVLSHCGAADTQAVQVAGPAGSCIPESGFHRRLAFDDVPTGGSFMVFDRSRDMLDVVHNFAAFFAHETCGFCTPCRVGTTLIRDLVDKIHSGGGTRYDVDELRRIGGVMRKTAHCGLGHTAANPVFDTLDHFPELYEARLRPSDYEPGFDLDNALEEARRATGRDDARAHL